MADTPEPTDDGAAAAEGWIGGEPEPESEQQQEEQQQARAAPDAEPGLDAAKHAIDGGGILVDHRDLVPWRSPRLMQSMLQSGVVADELDEKTEETYLKEALLRGEQLGWKSKKAVRQIAARRYRRGELHRRKLLYMVLDMRQGLIDSNAELSAVVSPQKKVSIDDDKEMMAKLAEEQERRERMMISEEQRAVASNARIDEQMALKLEKEKEQIAEEMRFARLREQQKQKAHERTEAAMLWQIELVKQRVAEEEEENAKAEAFEVARVEKDEVLKKLLKQRKMESAEKALSFSRVQQKKVDKIQAQWKAKEKKMFEMKIVTEKKLLASEAERDTKRKKDAEKRQQKAHKKSEDLARRLQGKRKQDEKDRILFIKTSEKKHANVDAALAAKKAAKDKEIKGMQEMSKKKEAERQRLARARADLEEKRLGAIVEQRAEKNKVFDKVRELNEEANVLKAGKNVDSVLKCLDSVLKCLDFVLKMFDFVLKMLDFAENHAMKFEETVENIARQQRAEEFRAEMMKLEQQQKVERAELLNVKKGQIAAERRYAAQQFLIQQENMREQLGKE